jgi:hypothetical protein
VGRYAPVTGSVACLAAEPGHYVELSGQSAQASCPAGSFQPISGQLSCEQAARGNFVPTSGSASEIACPAGTTTPKPGATAESECGVELEVGPSPLPEAQVGQAYSVQLTVSGGTGPYKWKKKAALPKGLKLSSGGVLSGKPSSKLAPGTYEIKVEVTDAKRHTAAATLELTIG